MRLPFQQDLDVEGIHVQAASEVVFICGGPFTSASEPTPLSIRDAFLKIMDNPPLRDRDIIQAEDITKLFIFQDYYGDFLQFETDLAQITELILLFCESEGSLAELGSFVLIDEIASRLLVIVRDKHWREDSFVKLGPLRFIQRLYGNESVFVIDDNDIGMVGSSAAGIQIDTLRELLEKPLTDRLDKTRDPTTLDRSRAGHVIKLIVGLIQEYGALTLDEIDELLLELDVYRPTRTILAYLLCAKSIGWVVEKRKGSTDYFFATNLRDAANLKYKKRGSQVNNKLRRRALIREHWKKTDRARYTGIEEILKGVLQ